MVQKVELLDQVLYDFPDLVVVMRHGAEPWVDMAVKLNTFAPSSSWGSVARSSWPMPRRSTRALVQRQATALRHTLPV